MDETYGSTPGSTAVAELSTPVGVLAFAVSEVGLAEVRWGRAGGFISRSGSAVVSDPGRTEPVARQLTEYFGGERRRFDLALDWRHATRSARSVLEALYESVPFGDSITYGALAELTASGIPARAIGGIMGRNPLPVVVPCHRVLAHDGLGGYSGGSGGDGLEVKRWLLTLEGVLPPTLDWDRRGLV